MPPRQSNRVLRHICNLAAAESSLADRELLERFNDRRDEAAFAALVRRHGPMVMRLSRGILQNEQDAEDAFQATFLVLSQKAASLQPRQSLCGWLYSVAYRVAQKARIDAARRRKYEARAADARQVADPLAQVTLREAHQVLDEELARLPDKFRAPVVLCYLEGLTRDEAARRLGWASSTLKSRLERARERLRARLVSRGLALSGALVASLFGTATASAVVPFVLVNSTVKAATSIAAGGAATTVVSAKVAALTEGACKAMIMSKLKVSAAMLLLMGVLTSGAWHLIDEELAVEPQAPTADKKASAESSQKADADRDLQELRGHSGSVRLAAFSPNGTILASGSLGFGPGSPAQLGDDDELILWDLASEKAKSTLKFPTGTLRQLAFSPDGKTLAVGTNGEIELRDAETGEVKRVLKGRRAGSGVVSLAFSPDGKTLASGGVATENTIRLWDVPTGVLKWTLDGHSDEVVDVTFSSDGKTLASTGGQDDPTIRLWDVEQGKPKLTLKMEHQPWSLLPGAFSRDGKILAKASGGGVVFLDTQTGQVKDRLIRDHAKGRPTVHSLAFSPDGKLVAGGRESGDIDLWETRPADSKFDWRAGDLKQTFREHRSPVWALAFSPSGEVLASGDGDGVVRVRRLKKESPAPSQPIKRENPGPDKPKGPTPLDRARIQGTWNLMVERSEKSGANVPPSLKVFSVTFKGDTLVTKSEDPSGKEANDQGRFQLDQATDPKTIAFNLGNDQFKGVYMLLDDELVMAWTKADEFQGTGAAC